MNNPENSDGRGVKKKEIYKLFPNCYISLKRITLAPPITRFIAPYSYLACYLLEKLKIFNTHYIGIIKKGETVFVSFEFYMNPCFLPIVKILCQNI
mgnify:CR=1